jgi:hypothetical protein
MLPKIINSKFNCAEKMQARKGSALKKKMNEKTKDN